MTDYDFNRPKDQELEDALAFVANLRSEHPGEDTPTAENSAVSASVTPDPVPAPVPAEPPLSFRSVVASEEELLPVEETPRAVSPKETARAAGKSAKKSKAEEEDTEDKAKEKPSLRFLTRLFPVKGDPWWEVLRKLVFLVALVVMVGSLAMLLNESVIIPNRNAQLTEDLQNMRVISGEGELTPEEAAYDGYPEGINVSFKKLYYLNNDVRGWLSYSSCNVNNVVLYSKERDYYLYRNIYRSNDKNGSLFFDVENDLTDPSAHYKSLVIYGHNMNSGQMLAGLNQLGKSVDVMKRAGSIIKLDTLTESHQYKIFAVVVQDSLADIQHYFSIQQTSFANNGQFLDYVKGLRARSLYDFNGVDVKADDDILILYTCCSKSVSGFNEARLGVVARKVRPGESANVDPATITVNKDVIMPYAYYIAQKKTPHAFYTTGILPGEETPTTQSSETVPTESGTPTSEGSATEPTSTGSSGDGEPTVPVVINPTDPTAIPTGTTPAQSGPVTEPTGTGPTTPSETIPTSGDGTTGMTDPTSTGDGTAPTTIESTPAGSETETTPTGSKTETPPTDSETETAPTETEPTAPTESETEAPSAEPTEATEPTGAAA